MPRTKIQNQKAPADAFPQSVTAAAACLEMMMRVQLYVNEAWSAIVPCCTAPRACAQRQDCRSDDGAMPCEDISTAGPATKKSSPNLYANEAACLLGTKSEDKASGPCHSKDL